MLRYHRPTPEAHAQLERRLKEPALPDAFFEALRAMGKLRVDKNAGERERFDARARAVLSLYRDERSNRHWIDGSERLTEFDERVVGARQRHSRRVDRVIGA